MLDESVSKPELFSAYLNLSKFSSNRDVSIYYGSKALQIAENIGDDVRVAKAHLRLSNPWRRKGDLEKALNHVLIALDIFKNVKDDKGVSEALNVIGTTYGNQGNYRAAISYNKQAVEINSKLGRLTKLANDYNNLGETYRLWKKLDSALINYQKALDLYIQEEVDYGIAYATGNIGLVFAEQGKYELAEDKMEEATLTLEKLGDRYPIAVYQTSIADIYRERGDLHLALKSAHQSLTIGEEEKLKEQIRDASLKLSELYSEKGDYKKAFEYQSQYLAYRDSINSAETIRKMADLRTEFEVSQKQIEVDLLNQEKKTQQAVGIGLVSGLSMVVVLVIVLLRNNEKKKKINDLLEEQKLKLEQTNETKDKFFSIISHDLRGPVNAFHGISQLIKAYISNGRTEELMEVTDDIDKSVDGLSELLDNLLNWAVQQQGHVPNVPEKVSFNEMVTDLFKTFDNMAKSKSISLESGLGDDIALWVDRNSTMTILRNIVNNSLKFTETGGKVIVSATSEEEIAVIKITDTGIGIPKEKLKELFELKARERSWGTDGEKGLGLGLQLAYEFVRMNNGSIEVESAVDEGTTFIVRLPLFEKVGDPVEVKRV